MNVLCLVFYKTAHTGISISNRDENFLTPRSSNNFLSIVDILSENGYVNRLATQNHLNTVENKVLFAL